ncbi:hypothetical protein EDB83DRAFT_2335113 [Lactarius deliciosus]|nr:hypothetical protein EDB83DRAFT_2335113 [Lactarius deliciosus]
MPDNPTHLMQAASGIEFIFLGTGTSGSLPNVSCLTAPKSDAPCKTCLSTLKAEGKKNIRRNTSAVMRIEGKDGKKRTIVIDVGKNFQAAAVEWFPKYGLRHIDAVLISHAHADAMNGLDDLRGWTLRGSIQKFIDVYASQATFAEVERSFPYMVSREYASGGGDIPEFKWHIFDDKVPIDVADSVQHGRLWAAAAPPASPSTPKPDSPAVLLAPPAAPALPSRQPLASVNDGQGIQDSVIYLSDVSWISDESWAVINQPSVNDPSHRYAVAIVDCLRPIAHISHYGIREAVNVSHEEYVTIGEHVGGKTINNPTATEKHCIDLVDEGKKIWLRPSHDGLRFEVSKEGAVKDNNYE